MYRTCTFMLLCFTWTALVAQNIQKADSLITVLESGDLTKKESIDLMLTIANRHPDASIALNYATEALKLAVSLNDPQLQAESHEEIGAIQRVLGNNIEATRASLNALQLFEKLGREDLKTAALVQLGNNAVTDEDYALAIDSFRKALVFYESSNRTLWIALTQLNMGEAFRLADQLDSAIYHFETALAINDTLNHPIVASYAKGNLGMAYNTMGRLQEARKALDESLKLVVELGDPYTHAVYLADLALIDQKEQQWSSAANRFNYALDIAQRNDLKEQIRDISKMMVTFHKLRGDYEKALAYQELFQVYQDSLVNKENVQDLERLKANHQITQRDSQIDLLNERDSRRRQQTYAAIGAMTVFFGLSLLLYRSNRAKQQANQTLIAQKEVIRNREEEKALLLRELNHRVKNNLQMISSLLNLQGSELKGHPAEAAIAAGKYRVDALALIHQKLYREDIHTTVALKDYIEELVLNLCYSFGDRLKPDLEIEDIPLSIDQAIPLALIVNELVTNALKYAYTDKTECKLTIGLSKTPQQLTLLVKDNGIGMPDEALEKQASFGLKLVHSLTRQLKGTIEYSKDGGSSWTLTTPMA